MAAAVLGGVAGPTSARRAPVSASSRRPLAVRASGPSSPPADIQKKVSGARVFLLKHASGDADDVCLHKSTPEVESAVNTLIAAGSSMGLARRSISESEGLWAVFYAPHVQKLTELTGIKFGPLRYKLTPLPAILAATVHASNAGSVGIETNVSWRCAPALSSFSRGASPSPRGGCISPVRRLSRPCRDPARISRFRPVSVVSRPLRVASSLYGPRPGAL